MNDLVVNAEDDAFQTIFVDNILKNKIDGDFSVRVVSKDGEQTLKFYSDIYGKTMDVLCFETPVGFDLFTKTKGKPAMTYAGIGTTCQELINDIHKWDNGFKNPNLFALNNVPIANVSRSFLENLADHFYEECPIARFGINHGKHSFNPLPVDKARGKWKILMAKIAIVGVVTNGKFDLLQRESSVLDQILQDIDKKHGAPTKVFFTVFPPKNNHKDAPSGWTTIKVDDVNNHEYVVGINDRINAVPYVLGGLDAIDREQMLKRERPKNIQSFDTLSKKNIRGDR